MAKSFGATLMDIAIDCGFIAIVEDRVVKYLASIEANNIESVRIENLLMMNTKRHYTVGPIPWTDDTTLCCTPHVRRCVTRSLRGDWAPGERLFYANHNTYLLGMIREKVTGMTVSKFMDRHLWTRIGDKFEATLSRNNASGTLEQVPSGLNARAINFSNPGVLYLDATRWNGDQIVSGEHVPTTTSPAKPRARYFPEWMVQLSRFYEYQWWGHLSPEGEYSSYAGAVYGQVIFSCPARNQVVARFGERHGECGTSWHHVAHEICVQIDEVTIGNPRDRD